jgi:beta-lactamase regulating signal transducer with metallopeptidase domain
MSTWTQALSTALIDFLWQGALVGLALWAALAVLRRRSAAAQYTACCVALLTLCVLPLVTIMTLWSMSSAPTPGSEAGAAAAGTAALSTMPQTVLRIWMVPETPTIAWLARVQQWALPIWSLGVLLFSLRLVSGCLHSVRLQRAAASSDDIAIATVAQLSNRLGIDRPARVLTPSVVEGPSVVGWLRPAILLPPAAAIGLSAQQL